MLVVHALWSPGRGVLLWAEDGERPATGRSRALRTARPHPFAVPAAALATLHPGTPTQVTLLLPAHSGGPLASPELVRSAPGPAPRGTPELRAWAVPAVAVDPAELDDPAEELRYGASVAHLRAVVAFADDLARRGHVLPTLERAGTAARARWRPVVQGIDQAAVEALVATMPPVARAEPAGTANAPADPAALVADALDVLVDAAVRDRLARAGVAHRGGRGAVDAWLTALTSPDDRLPARRGARPAGRGPGRRGTPSAPSRPAPPAPVSGSPRSGRWPRNTTTPATARTGGWSSSCSPRTDPSLLVAATQVWAGAADRLIADPQEVLLAELGRAARVYPPLAAALQTARPDGLDLSPEGAHHVLVAGAALLVDAGFAVQLPAGWDGARRVGLRLSARSTPAQGVVVRGGLGREEVAAFRWSLAVGDGADAALDEEEIAALVAAKAPLVRLRGAWVSVDQAALRRGLEFLRRGRPPAADGRRRARARRGRPGRRPAAAADRHRRGRVARRPARRHRGPDADPGRAAGHVHRAAAALPAARRRLAGVPLLARAGRLPGRRHGPGQDRPAARARVRRPRRRRSRARRCCSAPCPWSARGSARPPASSRTCGCAPTTAPAGLAATTCARPSRTPTCWSPPTRPPPATPTTSPRSTGTGSCSTRPRR